MWLLDVALFLTDIFVALLQTQGSMGYELGHIRPLTTFT